MRGAKLDTKKETPKLFFLLICVSYMADLS